MIFNRAIIIWAILGTCLAKEAGKPVEFEPYMYKDGDDHLEMQMREISTKIKDIEKELQTLRQLLENGMANLNERLDSQVENTQKNTDSKNQPLQQSTYTSIDDEEAYKKAYQAILSKEYDNAIILFNSFTKDFPNSDYLSNAYYWLGEIYLKKGNYIEANNNFDIVINKYYDSTKVPSAMLKRAYSLIELNKVADAKNQLMLIMQKFPNTATAAIADKKLANLP